MAALQEAVDNVRDEIVPLIPAQMTQARAIVAGLINRRNTLRAQLANIIIAQNQPALIAEEARDLQIQIGELYQPLKQAGSLVSSIRRKAVAPEGNN